MGCRNCRHARVISTDEWRKSLVMPSQTLGTDLSLATHPQVRELLDRDTQLRCTMHGGIVDPAATCDAHSLVVLGTIAHGFRTLLTGRNSDEELRRALRLEREARRKEAEERETADRFEKKPIAPKVCEFCEREHVQCTVCQAARGECAICESCGFKADVRKSPTDLYRSGFKWESLCKRCGFHEVRAWEDLPALVGWDRVTGRCQGCEEAAQKKEAANG